MCVFWVVARLPDRLKSTFSDNFFFTPGPLFGDPPLLEKISKTVDFCLWDKQYIVLPKWIFSAFYFNLDCTIFPIFSPLCIRVMRDDINTFREFGHIMRIFNLLMSLFFYAIVVCFFNGVPHDIPSGVFKPLPLPLYSHRPKHIGLF